LRLGSASTKEFGLEVTKWIRSRHGEVDVVHALQSFAPLQAATMGVLGTKIPVFCSPMNGDRELIWMTGQKGIFKRILYRRVNAWIAKSEPIAVALEKFGKPLFRIPNGVDSVQFAPTKREDGRRRALFVGRMLRPKRVDVLLAAWRELKPDMDLWLAGDGPLLEEWKGLGDGTEGVQFLGLRSDVPDLFKSSDYLVFPSDSEGMPNALLEAMACGLPSVASAVGAIPAMLEGGAGRLVAENTPAAWVAALREVLGDDAVAADLGQKARARVEERYSLNSTVDQILAVYRQFGAS
jgi:glycosyltransferase involved in cell wall biosynthesis